MKNLLIVIFIFMASAKILRGQAMSDSLDNVLSFEEYLGYVKQHHPMVKQANLRLNMGEATLLKARGGFDPKIEVDYDRKKFKDTEYYDQLNATFKIPTWYGVEFKANFEENTGEFLNPSKVVPDDGLYSAGVSFSLAQGLLTNDRMAMLKQARFFIDQTEAERNLLVNDLIFEASIAYFEWLEASNELTIYESFLTNAEIRYQGILRSVEEGDIAAIDATEARITLQTRILNLEAARLKTRKASLKASTYLWLDDIPLEIEEGIKPVMPTETILSSSLLMEDETEIQEALTNHPKLRSIEAKVKGLEVDRGLKRNKLLPKLDLQYNFLTQDADQINSFNTANYKAFVNFSMPIFLRKERGDVRLANIKLQDANFERVSTSLNIQNKIMASKAEISSLKTTK